MAAAVGGVLLGGLLLGGCGSQSPAGSAATSRAALSVPLASGPAVSAAPVAVPALPAMSAGVAGDAVEADLLVTATRPLTPAEVQTVSAVPGVQAVHPVDTGTVPLGAHRVSVLGVVPATFRQWTPTATRLSDPLWASVAAGEMSSTVDASTNLALPLGSTQPVGGALLRLGALAAIGLPGYDVTVSTLVGQRLGLTPGAALLVSAPKADLVALRNRLAAATPVGVSVALLRSAAPAATATGGFLPNARVAAMVAAATAQTGKPYVWGATGPGSFDCSGLVGFAFAAIGVAMPRTSQQLWLTGPQIPANQAQSGDLLFWANDPTAPGDLDHVAIYLGGGQMLSAPRTGDVVHVSAVPPRNFRGIVRPDPRRAGQVGGPMWALGG